MGRARTLVAVGIAGVGALLLSGCGITVQSHHYEDQTGVRQHITKVQVDGASSLNVRTGDATSVHRTVEFAENDPGKDTWRVDGNTLVLEDCDHADCSVGYDVVVPAGTTITGEVGSGSIEIDGLAQVNFRAHSGSATVRNVSGTVNLRADSGSVNIQNVGGAVSVQADSGSLDLSNIAGALTASADSGKVKATGIAGPAKVDASSGDVTVRMSAVQDVTAHASSGRVEVSVPQGAYRVTARTDSGDTTTGVPNDPSGQHLLDVQSDSGDVSVQYA